MKLIDLYKEWMETGRITNGLCNSVPKKYSKELSIFKDDDYTAMYWGNGEDIKAMCWDDWKNRFTPLRQTIVLLICAMCDEL